MLTLKLAGTQGPETIISASAQLDPWFSLKVFWSRAPDSGVGYDVRFWRWAPVLGGRVYYAERACFLSYSLGANDSGVM